MLRDDFIMKTSNPCLSNSSVSLSVVSVLKLGLSTKVTGSQYDERETDFTEKKYHRFKGIITSCSFY